jgi:hypothetical protein
VHAGDAGADVAHAHGVQSAAEAPPPSTISGMATLCATSERAFPGHRELRLGDRGRRAAYVAADVRGLVAERLDQACAERVVDRRHVQERLPAEQGAQLAALVLHRSSFPKIQR